jgi:hypothetical protein
MSKREKAQTAAIDFGTASIARIKMAASPMSPQKRPDFLRQKTKLWHLQQRWHVRAQIDDHGIAPKRGLSF